MTAYTFTIRARERNQIVGSAVICADARYVSVQWLHPPRLERRFAAPAEWKAILQELDAKLPANPLEDTSAIVRVIAGERAPWLQIQYLTAEPIDAEPQKVVMQLDQRLRLVQQT